MDKECIGQFGGYKVWKLTGVDIKSAVDALETGKVDGLSISKCFGFMGHNLECLAEFRNLRMLVLNDLKSVDISYVNRMQELEYLSLGDVEGTVNLVSLARLKHLRFTERKSIYLPAIGLNNLQHLAIWGFKDTDLARFLHYKKLENLEIIQAKKLISLNGIEHCTNLTQLVVAYCPKLQKIRALQDLKSLEVLDFQNTKHVQDFEVLGKLIRLKKLIIDRAGSIKNLSFAHKLKNLEHLVIRETLIESFDLSPLLHLPALSHIFLDKKKEYEPVSVDLATLVASRAVERS